MTDQATQTQRRKPTRLGPRKRLFRDLLLLLFLTIGSLLVAVFIAGETLRDRLAQEQLQGLAQQTSENLTGFLQLPENSLRMAQGWGKAGDLDLADTPRLGQPLYSRPGESHQGFFAGAGGFRWALLLPRPRIRGLALPPDRSPRPCGLATLERAGGLIATLLLTRHYVRHLKALPSLTDHPAEFEEKVLALVRYGESPNLEFKSTLRTNLKTGKAGKEIELAWLKSVPGWFEAAIPPHQLWR
jgi:hypothetical protein